MDDKEYFKEIREIEKNYLEIIKDIPFTTPKPKNLIEEKKKFLAAIADDKYYNPKFDYGKRRIPDSILKEIKEFKVNTKNDIYGFKKLIKENLSLLYYKLKAFQTWGDPISTKYNDRVYGKPSIFLLSKAKNYARKYKTKKVKFKTLTPKIAAQRLREYTKKLTNSNIDIKYVSMGAKINIKAKSQLIQVNPNERFTSRDVKRLKVHEIGTHYLRYYNAKKFKIRLLETGTPNYLTTEEGLATYMEEIKGVSSQAQIFIYAGRTIATYYARKKSFYEVFEILRKYGYNNEVAWTITFRAKRNISDTSKKGGYSKDYVYFEGYNKIKKYAKHNDIRKLFIGKIKIEDVNKMKKFIDKNQENIVTIFDIEKALNGGIKQK